MSIRTVAVALIFAAPILAQCSNITGIIFTQFGDGCSGYGQDPPTLAGSYDPSTCTVTLSLTGWNGNCPGICMFERLLAVGSAPQQVPIGFLPCDLLIVPDFILSFPPAAGTSWVFQIPSGPMAGLNFYLQGGHHFQQGTSHEFEVSNRLQLTFY